MGDGRPLQVSAFATHLLNAGADLCEERLKHQEQIQVEGANIHSKNSISQHYQ